MIELINSGVVELVSAWNLPTFGGEMLTEKHGIPRNCKYVLTSRYTVLDPCDTLRRMGIWHFDKISLLRCGCCVGFTLDF